MFDSLDEQMKADERKSSSLRERAMKWVLGSVVLVVIVGGLYIALHMLPGG